MDSSTRHGSTLDRLDRGRRPAAAASAAAAVRPVGRTARGRYGGRPASIAGRSAGNPVRFRDCPATVTGERTSTAWPRPFGVGRPGASGSGSQETCLPPVDSEGREDVGSGHDRGSPWCWVGRGAASPSVAERLAAALPPPVAYVATAVIDPARPDPDFAARVEAHRRRRPASWRTIEAGRRPGRRAGRRRGQRPGRRPGHLGGGARPASPPTSAGLCAVLRARAGPDGAGLRRGRAGGPSLQRGGPAVPGRPGSVNRAVADVADRVLLVVAGRVLALEPRPPVRPRAGGRGAEVRAALSFLTPFGGAVPRARRRSTGFPSSGAVIGLALGGVWWLAGPGLARPGGGRGGGGRRPGRHRHAPLRRAGRQRRRAAGADGPGPPAGGHGRSGRRGVRPGRGRRPCC